jgi:hypothetical protein
VSRACLGKTIIFTIINGRKAGLCVWGGGEGGGGTRCAAIGPVNACLLSLAPDRVLSVRKKTRQSDIYAIYILYVVELLSLYMLTYICLFVCPEPVLAKPTSILKENLRRN